MEDETGVELKLLSSGENEFRELYQLLNHATPVSSKRRAFKKYSQQISKLNQNPKYGSLTDNVLFKRLPIYQNEINYTNKVIVLVLDYNTTVAKSDVQTSLIDQLFRLPTRPQLVRALKENNQKQPSKLLCQYIHNYVIPAIFSNECDHNEVLQFCNLITAFPMGYTSKLLTTSEIEAFEELVESKIPQLRREEGLIKDWATYCSTLIYYSGEILHHHDKLSNAILNTIETGFRIKSVEDQLMAYDCWKTLISNYSMNEDFFNAPKQLSFLLRPLVVDLPMNPDVAVRRFDTCEYLMKFVKEPNEILPELLDTIFGPFDAPVSRYCPTNGNLQYVRDSLELWQKINAFFMEIAGRLKNSGNLTNADKLIECARVCTYMNSYYSELGPRSFTVQRDCKNINKGVWTQMLIMLEIGKGFTDQSIRRIAKILEEFVSPNENAIKMNSGVLLTVFQAVLSCSMQGKSGSKELQDFTTSVTKLVIMNCDDKILFQASSGLTKEWLQLNNADALADFLLENPNISMFKSVGLYIFGNIEDSKREKFIRHWLLFDHSPNDKRKFLVCFSKDCFDVLKNICDFVRKDRINVLEAIRFCCMYLNYANFRFHPYRLLLSTLTFLLSKQVLPKRSVEFIKEGVKDLSFCKLIEFRLEITDNRSDIDLYFCIKTLIETLDKTELVSTFLAASFDFKNLRPLTYAFYSALSKFSISKETMQILRKFTGRKIDDALKTIPPHLKTLPEIVEITNHNKDSESNIPSSKLNCDKKSPASTQPNASPENSVPREDTITLDMVDDANLTDAHTESFFTDLAALNLLLSNHCSRFAEKVESESSIACNQITSDTPKKSSDLIQDTTNIAPIVKDKVDDHCEPEVNIECIDEVSLGDYRTKLDSAAVNESDLRRSGKRSDELLNFLGNVNKSSPISRDNKLTQPLGSPQTSPIRRVILNSAEERKNIPEICTEPNTQDILTFEREISSSLATPKIGSLKRKSDALYDATFSFAKLKRERNFSDSPTTSEKTVFKRFEKRKFVASTAATSVSLKRRAFEEYSQQILKLNQNPKYGSLTDNLFLKHLPKNQEEINYTNKVMDLILDYNTSVATIDVQTNLIDQLFHPPTRPQLVKALKENVQKEPSELLFKFIHHRIIPAIFSNEYEHNEVLQFCDLITAFPMSFACKFMTPSDIKAFEEFVISKILQLRCEEGLIKDWGTYCSMLIHYSGEILHHLKKLMNAILNIIETGFRTKSVEDRLMAYDCWKTLILNYSIKEDFLKGPKQMTLLLKPLVIKLSMRPRIAIGRFDTCVCFMKCIKEPNGVLPELLDTIFGPFDVPVSRYCSTNDNLRYIRDSIELWQKINVFFMEIAGRIRNSSNLTNADKLIECVRVCTYLNSYYGELDPRNSKVCQDMNEAVWTQMLFMLRIDKDFMITNIGRVSEILEELFSPHENTTNIDSCILLTVLQSVLFYCPMLEKFASKELQDFTTSVTRLVIMNCEHKILCKASSGLTNKWLELNNPDALVDILLKSLDMSNRYKFLCRYIVPNIEGRKRDQFIRHWLLLDRPPKYKRRFLVCLSKECFDVLKNISDFVQKDSNNLSEAIRFCCMYLNYANLKTLAYRLLLSKLKFLLKNLILSKRSIKFIKEDVKELSFCKLIEFRLEIADNTSDNDLYFCIRKLIETLDKRELVSTFLAAIPDFKKPTHLPPNLCKTLEIFSKYDKAIAKEAPQILQEFNRSISTAKRFSEVGKLKMMTDSLGETLPNAAESINHDKDTETIMSTTQEEPKTKRLNKPNQSLETEANELTEVKSDKLNCDKKSLSFNQPNASPKNSDPREDTMILDIVNNANMTDADTESFQTDEATFNLPLSNNCSFSLGNAESNISIAGSAITSDTSKKCSEFIPDTTNISPIVKEKVDSHYELDVAFGSTDNDSISECKSKLDWPAVNKSGIRRSAKRHNLFSSMNRSSPISRGNKLSQTLASSQTDRIRSLILNCGEDQKNNSKISDQPNPEDILTFNREIASPSAEPKIGILKRKSNVIDNTTFPCAKRKQVYLSDPPTISEKTSFKRDDKNKSPTKKTAVRLEDLMLDTSEPSPNVECDKEDQTESKKEKNNSTSVNDLLQNEKIIRESTDDKNVADLEKQIRMDILTKNLLALKACTKDIYEYYAIIRKCFDPSDLEVILNA